MTNIKKIWQGWLAFSFVLIHFTFIILYAFPQQFVSERTKSVAAVYVDPLFVQKWSMFAPCPVLDMKVKLKIHHEKGESDWFYPGEEYRKKHSFWRGSWHGDYVITEINMLHWVYADLAEFEQDPENISYTDKKKFQTSKGGLMLQRFIKGISLSFFDALPIEAYAICEFNNVKTDELIELELPVYKYPQ